MTAAAARDTSAGAAARLPAARSAAEAARRMADDAAALVTERATRDHLHLLHLTARETAVRLGEEALRVREARIDGMRAELAASMTDGSPCPVCGSLDHPDPVEPTFAPVGRDQEEAASQRAAQAATAASQAGSEVAAAEARLDELAIRLNAVGFAALLATVAPAASASVTAPGVRAAGTSAAATTRDFHGPPAAATAIPVPARTPAPTSPPVFTLDAARHAHPATLAAAADQAETEAARQEDQTVGLADQAAMLPGRQHDLDDLDDAIANGKATLTELAGERATALSEAEGAAARAVARRRDLRAQLGSATDLDAALAEARRLADALSLAADAADEAARTAAEAAEASARARAAAIGAGFGPVAGVLAAELGGTSPGVGAGWADAGPAGLGGTSPGVGAGWADAGPAGLGGTSPGVGAGRADAGPADADGDAAVAAAGAAFRDPAWRADAAERIARHDAEAEAVASLLADPELAAVTLDPPAPVGVAAEAAEAAQRAHDEAVAALGRARDRTGQLAALRPRLDGALGALAPVRDKADQVRQLADLANGTGSANQYKMTLSSFVLAARLEEVAAAASERLLTMTAGRYSLVHSDARRGNARAGLSLLACDAWTGSDRDTATLSGGETFLASLALALGLADVVAAEAAGTPMEALFVDEGFGTLDEEALDEVMNVLDGLRQAAASSASSATSASCASASRPRSTCVSPVTAATSKSSLASARWAGAAPRASPQEARRPRGISDARARWRLQNSGCFASTLSS